MRTRTNRKLVMGMLMAVFAASTVAQEPNGRIHWQLSAGLSYANVLSVPGTEGLLGYRAGGVADVAVSRNGMWRVQPGLQLAEKGWTFNGYLGDEQILPARFSTRLHYLELPVMMAARLPLGRNGQLTFKAGPYVAYGLNATTRASVNDTDGSETFSENHFSAPCDFLGMAYDKESHRVAYPKFHRWDVGLTEGIDFSTGHFVVGASLSIGLTPLTDRIFLGNTLVKVASTLFGGGRPRNITADLSVGYKF